MTFTIDAPLTYGFIIALVRASAWLLLVPPFATRTIPNQIKVGLSASLAFAAAPEVKATPPASVAGLIGMLVLQVAIGATLGFLAMVLLSAITSAGTLIGLVSGLNTPPSLDPLGLSADSVVGNFFQMITNALLVVGGGFLVLTRGFLLSFQAAPTHAAASLDTTTEGLAKVVTSSVAQFFMAALEIAVPIAVVMLVVQVAIALASKASPQLNVLGLAFPLQNLLTILLLGGLVATLPSVLDTMVGRSLLGMQDIGTAFG
jgi:flagellar biosynthetic protein FliR